jgi:hypothetical protein
MVIMSHGVAVAVVVPRSSHRVVSWLRPRLSRCVWVGFRITWCRGSLSSRRVGPRGAAVAVIMVTSSHPRHIAVARRRHTSSPSCHCHRGRWLGRGRPWRERTAARLSAREVRGARALCSEVEKRKKNYVHICCARVRLLLVGESYP